MLTDARLARVGGDVTFDRQRELGPALGGIRTPVDMLLRSCPQEVARNGHLLVGRVAGGPVPRRLFQVAERTKGDRL